jgi:hypothetical protein
MEPPFVKKKWRMSNDIPDNAFQISSTDPTSFKSIIEQFTDEYDNISTLVNNSYDKPIDKTEQTRFKKYVSNKLKNVLLKKVIAKLIEVAELFEVRSVQKMIRYRNSGNPEFAKYSKELLIMKNSIESDNTEFKYNTTTIFDKKFASETKKLNGLLTRLNTVKPDTIDKSLMHYDNDNKNLRTESELLPFLQWLVG